MSIIVAHARHEIKLGTPNLICWVNLKMERETVERSEASSGEELSG